MGTHLVALSVARKLRTKLNWCFQHIVPSHVGGGAQELGSSPACRQLQDACYLPRSSLLPQGIPPSCHIRDQDAVLQPGHGPANGSRNLWTTASMPPPPTTGHRIDAKRPDDTLEGQPRSPDVSTRLLFPPLDAHWQGVVPRSTISAETHVTCSNPTHPTPAVYPRTERLLSVG